MGCYSQIEQLREHSKSFRKNTASEIEKEAQPGPRDYTKLEQHDENIKTEEHLGNATPTNEDGEKKEDPKHMASSRTAKTGHVPFVHITFSEPEKKINYSPSKPLFTKQKTRSCALLHNVNHSFNVLAHKENEKTKKNRKTRIMSAPDNTKHQRALSNSNRNHRKSFPLPTLVYSSMPSPSKVSKKVAYPTQGTSDRRSKRSQTQLSHYSQKRVNSPSNTPISPRSKSSHDFQDIKYSDMFFEITSQGGDGPVMHQMFPPTVYVNVFKSFRETNSASSTRCCSSKASHASSSRENSARSKRPKLKNKNASASSHRRRNSVSKQEDREKGQNKTENTVIISGVDWEIKAKKQDGDNAELPVNELMDAKHPNPDLPTINEATIENSSSVCGIGKETLKTLREMESRSSNVESNNPENVDQEVSEMGYAQQDSAITDDTQAPQVGSRTPQSPQNLNATETFTPFQQDEALRNWVHDDHSMKGSSVESKDDADFSHSSKNIQGSHSVAGSEQLTDDIISCLENLLLIAEESVGSMVVDREDGEPSANISEHEEVDEHNDPSNIQQINTNQSLMDQKSHPINYNPAANHPELHPNDSSIHWIKGEVLGKGAYGTVYRGLTSHGELIAVKQVTLHGSDPAVAEKEYKKLQEEVDLLKTLKHVNIVGYLGTSFEDTVVTIFMEYVPGGSISSVLRHFGPLQERVISRYTSHILQGISYLHRNRVVHRDVKGNNVMLMPNGVIKLIDFGCAKRLNGLSINGTRGEMLHSMHGTPYWMAPEVISESGHGEKSDIWSIGCTVFEMATGRPPLADMERMAAMFYIVMEKGLMPTLPNHFTGNAREFINLCLTRDQEERPSAEQLLQHPFVRWTS